MLPPGKNAADFFSGKIFLGGCSKQKSAGEITVDKDGDRAFCNAPGSAPDSEENIRSGQTAVLQFSYQSVTSLGPEILFPIDLHWERDVCKLPSTNTCITLI